MVKCPNCGEEVRKAKKGADGTFRHAGEGACGQSLKTKWVENHEEEIDEIERPEEEKQEGRGGGKGFGKTQRIFDKVDAVQDWVKASLPGLPDYGSDTSQAFVEYLEKHPNIVEDQPQLEDWVRNTFPNVSKIAMEDLRDRLKAIDKQYGREPAPPKTEGKEEKSDLKSDIKRLEKKLEEKPPDAASKMESVAKAKFFQKGETLIDRLNPLLTFLDLTVGDIKEDPEMRRLIREAFGIKPKEFMRKLAERRGERKESEEEPEEETQSPDEKAREARKKVEEEMDRGRTEKKGEEEVYDEIPEGL